MASFTAESTVCGVGWAWQALRLPHPTQEFHQVNASSYQLRPRLQMPGSGPRMNSADWAGICSPSHLGKNLAQTSQAHLSCLLTHVLAGDTGRCLSLWVCVCVCVSGLVKRNICALFSLKGAIHFLSDQNILEVDYLPTLPSLLQARTRGTCAHKELRFKRRPC